MILHDFRDTRPRRGWIVTTGAQFRNQDARGPLAPPREGRATAAVRSSTTSRTPLVQSPSAGRGTVTTCASRRAASSRHGYTLEGN
jgi:hypothetical protein